MQKNINFKKYLFKSATQSCVISIMVTLLIAALFMTGSLRYLASEELFFLIQAPFKVLSYLGILSVLYFIFPHWVAMFIAQFIWYFVLALLINITVAKDKQATLFRKKSLKDLLVSSFMWGCALGVTAYILLFLAMLFGAIGSANNEFSRLILIIVGLPMRLISSLGPNYEVVLYEKLGLWGILLVEIIWWTILVFIFKWVKTNKKNEYPGDKG